jgi:hypothetical protein
MPRLAVAALVSAALAAAAVLAAGVLASPAAAASWVRPVRGALARGFDVGGNPFAGGLHRGIDLAARAGAPVRAACGGRVVVAGRVGASGGVVTVACGRWRVSHLPLGRIAVRVGDRVAPGDPIGLAGRARQHAGLHLGVRDAHRRLGYVDPLRFLGPPRIRPPATAPPAGPRGGAVERRRHLPAPRPAAAAAQPVPAARGLAPWPAWAGLGLALAGAAGGGVRLRRSRWRRPAPGLPSALAERVR